jgi:isopentenyldiphosphate isomerase
VSFNPAEVAEVQWIELADLAAQIAAEPQKFTPWFTQEARAVGLLDDPRLN